MNQEHEARNQELRADFARMAKHIATRAAIAHTHNDNYCKEPLDCPVCRRRIERIIKGRR